MDAFGLAEEEKEKKRIEKENLLSEEEKEKIEKKRRYQQDRKVTYGSRAFSAGAEHGCRPIRTRYA